MTAVCLASSIGRITNAALPLVVYDGPRGAIEPLLGGVGYLFPEPLLSRSPLQGATSVGNVERYSLFGESEGGRAMVWSSTHEPDELPLPHPASAGTVAYGTNGVFGAIVGGAFVPAGNGQDLRAVKWTSAQAGPIVLPTLGRNAAGRGSAIANAVSWTGYVVGAAAELRPGFGAGPRAVRWSPDGQAIERLEPVGVNEVGETLNIALDINGARFTVGFAESTSIGQVAVLWDDDFPDATVLGHLGVGDDGKPSSGASDINDNGDIIGRSTRFVGGVDKGSRAVVWRERSPMPMELANLGTNADGNTWSQASAINEHGVIVGSASRPAGGTRAMRWDIERNTASALIAVPGFPVDAGYHATAINDVGGIVGSGNGRAIAWLRDGTPVDLTALLPANSSWVALTQAHSVSTVGWVTGIGLSLDGGAFEAGSFPLETEPYERFFSVLVPGLGTYGLGDANMDGLINFDDLLILAKHYNRTNPSADLNMGDFNLDGVIDFDDLLALARNYGSRSVALIEGAPVAFVNDWALAQSLVPEPASLAALGASTLGAFRPRRRDTRRSSAGRLTR